MKKEIEIEVDGVKRIVKTQHYITAKTKQLREFGYSTLTEHHVKEQLDAVLKKKKLNVIGMFMRDEVIK